MISVAEALSFMDAHRVQNDAVTCTVSEALGLRLATDLHAKVDRPPHDASAMDGYAVRREDSGKAGTLLRIVGEIPAGAIFDGEVRESEAVRVFTGSPIPKGANHVIIQENVTRDRDQITINVVNLTQTDIRKAGIDFKRGDLVIQKGTVVGPAEIALAAATNHSDLQVFKKPRLAIIAAGDELVPAGAAERLGDIVNSNTPALSALIKEWGGEVVFTHLVKDDPKAIKSMFEDAQQADIIVPVGGASVGDHDHMRRVFTELGGEMIFEQVAVKPGKPTWFGQIRDRPVLGLPGNPASAIVCAHLFLRPLMNGPKMVKSRAVLTQDLPPNGPREMYLRGRVESSSDSGQLKATPFPRQDSSLLTPFLRANALIYRDSLAPSISSGETVTVVALNSGAYPIVSS